LSNPIVIGESPVNFHPKIILEEVKTLSPSGKKKFQKVAKTFLMTTITFLASQSRSMAESLNKTDTLPTASAGMPPELMEFMMTALVIIVGVGIILSAILFASAGIMRMLGKKRRKESEEWSVDIIKGFVQVLLSTPIIFLIYYLVSMTLKSSGWFISPF
jgi:hypothetical protein